MQKTSSRASAFPAMPKRTTRRLILSTLPHSSSSRRRIVGPFFRRTARRSSSRRMEVCPKRTGTTCQRRSYPRVCRLGKPTRQSQPRKGTRPARGRNWTPSSRRSWLLRFLCCSVEAPKERPKGAERNGRANVLFSALRLSWLRLPTGARKTGFGVLLLAQEARTDENPYFCSYNSKGACLNYV